MLWAQFVYDDYIWFLLQANIYLTREITFTDVNPKLERNTVTGRTAGQNLSYVVGMTINPSTCHCLLAAREPQQPIPRCQKEKRKVLWFSAV